MENNNNEIKVVTSKLPKTTKTKKADETSAEKTTPKKATAKPKASEGETKPKSTAKPKTSEGETKPKSTAKPKAGVDTAKAESTAKPKTTAAKPKTTATKPKTTAAEPKTTAAKPKTTAAKPKTTAAKPKTTAAKPKTTAAKPKTTEALPKEEEIVNNEVSEVVEVPAVAEVETPEVKAKEATVKKTTRSKEEENIPLLNLEKKTRKPKEDIPLLDLDAPAEDKKTTKSTAKKAPAKTTANSKAAAKPKTTASKTTKPKKEPVEEVKEVVNDNSNEYTKEEILKKMEKINEFIEKATEIKNQNSTPIPYDGTEESVQKESQRKRILEEQIALIDEQIKQVHDLAWLGADSEEEFEKRINEVEFEPGDFPNVKDTEEPEDPTLTRLKNQAILAEVEREYYEILKKEKEAEENSSSDVVLYDSTLENDDIEEVFATPIDNTSSVIDLTLYKENETEAIEDSLDRLMGIAKDLRDDFDEDPLCLDETTTTLVVGPKGVRLQESLKKNFQNQEEEKNEVFGEEKVENNLLLIEVEESLGAEDNVLVSSELGDEEFGDFEDGSQIQEEITEETTEEIIEETQQETQEEIQEETQEETQEEVTEQIQEEIQEDSIDPEIQEELIQDAILIANSPYEEEKMDINAQAEDPNQVEEVKTEEVVDPEIIKKPLGLVDQEKLKTLKFSDALNEDLSLDDDQLVITLCNEINDTNVVSIYEKVKELNLDNKPKVLGVFIFYVHNFKTTRKKVCPMKYDTLVENKEKPFIGVSNFFGIYLAIRLKEVRGVKKMLNNIKQVNTKKNAFFKAARLFYRCKINDVTIGRYKPAFFKEFERIFIKNEKKLEAIEFDYYAMLLVDSYRNGYNKFSSKGLKMYARFKDKMSDDAKRYCLLQLGQNYLLNRNYKKARKAFNELATISDDKFDAYINLMLVHKKVETFQKLFAKTKIEKLPQYKELEQMSVGNESYEKRLEQFKNDSVIIGKRGKDIELKKYRKIVFVIGLLGSIILLSLNTFLDFEQGFLYGIISACLMPLSSCITNNFKNKIVFFIIKLILAGAIVYGFHMLVELL